MQKKIQLMLLQSEKWCVNEEGRSFTQSLLDAQDSSGKAPLDYWPVIRGRSYADLAVLLEHLLTNYSLRPTRPPEKGEISNDGKSSADGELSASVAYKPLP